MKTTVQNLTSKIVYAALFGMMLLTWQVNAQSKTINASGTFTVPHGVTSVTVECWGGGGKGGSTLSNGTETGGGGGGAYAKKNAVTVTPGSTQNVVVGLGSSTTAAGGDSYFISTTTILAKGGNSCANNSNTGAAGGSSSNSVGDVRRAGGAGANGSSGNYGGGGGSSAGPNNSGVAATNANGATAPTGGGNGGNGRSGSNGNGTAGTIPGGGGGGVMSSGSNSFSGGNGANGQVIISWSCSNTLTSATGTDNQSLCLHTSITTITYSMVGAYGATFSGLPTGVNGTYTDGAISITGTPTTAGVYNYTITPVNGCSSNIITGKITVLAPPTNLSAVASSTAICSGEAVNLIVSSNSNSALSAVIFNENFNGSSNGWTLFNTSIGGTVENAAWTLRANGYTISSETFTSNDASQFYMSNSDAQGSGTTTATQLVSPAFSTVGLTEATLTFYHYYRYYDGNESGLVQISTDGATWTTIAGPYTANQGSANGFSLVTLNLNAYVGHANVKIRFKYDATYDWYWAIDNVKVEGTFATAPEATYSWTSSPAGFTSDVKNPTGIVPTQTTTYTVTATNSYGCSSTTSVTVVVNQPLTFTNLSADANDILANATTTVRANDVSGTNANVSWFTEPNGNGNFLGTGADLSNVGPGKYYAQITGSCGTTIEQSIEVFGLSSWTGAINTLWNEAGNWAEGVVPNAYCKVTIGTGKTAEVLAQDATAYSLAIAGNGVLTVKSGKNITVMNAISTVNATNLIVESNANLVQVDAVANTTAITVKRKSAALKRLDYILWSSPVAGQNVLAFSPLTSVSPTSRFYTYNTTLNTYNSIATPSAVNFDAAKGYLIRVPNNHPTAATIWNGQFVGVPNNGNITYTLTNSADATKRYNLVGNPYPSAISLSKFIDANQNNIKGTVYFWRKTNGAPNSSYWAISKYGYSSNGEGVNPNGIIQVGQGFIVEAKADATQVVFNNDMRILDNANQMFKTGANATQSQLGQESDRFWVKMTSATGSYSQIMVGYFPEATNGLDSDIDAKQIADGDILLSTVVNAENYAIQGRVAPFDAADVVPMNYTVTTAGTYTLSLDAFEGTFNGNTTVFLKDNVAGTMVSLQDGNYTFTTAAGSFANRFELHYQTLLGQVELPQSESIGIKFVKGNLKVNVENDTIDEVQVYDLNGKKVASSKGIHAAQFEMNSLPKSTVLIVKVSTENKAVAVRKVM
ncbi:glycine-rich domain-containing protein [Flavobacterium stagni]|uniref:T9SS type A sorting domain-containing protein n=1 Tax=Flavobacterium stagni TaxID=2506421 RepID=A0A4Q1K815_9FLAO|nr:T9SS type A sorting domain-containing protein [Flavobacterium stagni]RXR22439.1 T9SS type A sorting domain-containing protein [Flavobacterium stagni]